MRPLNFGSPTDLKNLLAAELTAVGVTGGTQTTITANFPTGSSYPTQPQIAAAENLTRAQFAAVRALKRSIQDAGINHPRARARPFRHAPRLISIDCLSSSRATREALAAVGGKHVLKDRRGEPIGA
jgi:hypothetical protein